MKGKLYKKIYDVCLEAYNKNPNLKHDDIGNDVCFYFNKNGFMSVYIMEELKTIFDVSFISKKGNTEIYLDYIFTTKLVNDEFEIKETYTEKDLEKYYNQIKEQVDKM